VDWARASAAAGAAGHRACLQMPWPGQQCAAAYSSSHGEPWRGCWCSRSSGWCTTPCMHTRPTSRLCDSRIGLPLALRAQHAQQPTEAAQTDLQAAGRQQGPVTTHAHTAATEHGPSGVWHTTLLLHPRPPFHTTPALCVSVCVHRYFLSTALGLFNKKVVGKNYGVFGKGAFPGATPPQQQQQQRRPYRELRPACACSSPTDQQAALTACTRTHPICLLCPAPLLLLSMACHTHSPAVSYRCPVCVSKPAGPAGVCHRAGGAGWGAHDVEGVEQAG
jgi:hypothetical protein